MRYINTVNNNNNYKEYVQFLNRLYLYNLCWNSLLFSQQAPQGAKRDVFVVCTLEFIVPLFLYIIMKRVNKLEFQICNLKKKLSSN